MCGSFGVNALFAVRVCELTAWLQKTTAQLLCLRNLKSCCLQRAGVRSVVCACAIMVLSTIICRCYHSASALFLSERNDRYFSSSREQLFLNLKMCIFMKLPLPVLGQIFIKWGRKKTKPLIKSLIFGIWKLILEVMVLTQFYLSLFSFFFFLLRGLGVWSQSFFVLCIVF